MKYLKRYDPQHAPDPAAWLALDEEERIVLALQYHRRARVRLPNARLHATIHVIGKHIYDLLKEGPPAGDPNEPYWAELESLTAEGWRHGR
jgi:hypothetical protein